MSHCTRWKEKERVVYLYKWLDVFVLTLCMVDAQHSRSYESARV